MRQSLWTSSHPPFFHPQGFKYTRTVEPQGCMRASSFHDDGDMIILRFLSSQHNRFLVGNRNKGTKAESELSTQPGRRGTHPFGVPIVCSVRVLSGLFVGWCACFCLVECGESDKGKRYLGRNKGKGADKGNTHTHRRKPHTPSCRNLPTHHRRQVSMHHLHPPRRRRFNFNPSLPHWMFRFGVPSVNENWKFGNWILP